MFELLRRVYAIGNAIAPALNTNGGGNREVKGVGVVLTMKAMFAMRGRDYDNGYDQQMELADDDVTCTLTSATKDNLVL